MGEISIIEYSDPFAEQLKDLFVEMQEYLASLDDRGVIVLESGYRENYFQHILGEVQKKSGIIYLARADGLIVGAVVCLLIRGGEEYGDDGRPKNGFISDLVVTRKYRNNGIGTALLKEAEQYFRAQQCAHMQIEVFEPNTGAAKLYERYGLSTLSRYLSKRISSEKED